MTSRRGATRAVRYGPPADSEDRSTARPTARPSPVPVTVITARCGRPGAAKRTAQAGRRRTPRRTPMPHAAGNESLDSYVQAESVQAGFWASTRAYLVSLLKAWWGDAATSGNDFCYDYLPRLTGSHST